MHRLPLVRENCSDTQPVDNNFQLANAALEELFDRFSWAEIVFIACFLALLTFSSSIPRWYDFRIQRLEHFLMTFFSQYLFNVCSSKGNSAKINLNVNQVFRRPSQAPNGRSPNLRRSAQPKNILRLGNL